MIDRECALSILHELTQSASLRKRALGVEACLTAYARQFGQDEVGWAVTALLHDFDYEIHPSAPQHPRDGEPVLEARGIPPHIRRAILSHANYSGIPRETLLEKALVACDELSSFIGAVGLVRPGKCLEEFNVSLVRKKMKDQAIARSVSRDDLVKGVIGLGVELDAQVAFCVAAMQAREGEPGLG